MSEEIVKRTEMPVEKTWRLEDMYETNAMWEQDFARAEEGAKKIAEYRGKLGSRNEALDMLKTFFGVSMIAEQMYCYARMRRDEDNTLPAYQALTDRAQSLLVSLETAASYISPELLSQPEGYLKGLIEDPAFSEYTVFLGEILRGAPHTLSEKEERIVAMSGDMGSAAHTAYSMLNDADMKFPTIEGEHGPVEITHAGYIELMMNRERRVREAAFNGLYSTYKGYSATIPALYAANVKADLFYAQVSNFDTSLEAKLFPDDVPVAVYDNLVKAIRGHLSGLNRFVTRNGKLIGVDHMRMIDLYVPAVTGFDIALPFDEAYALVVDCLAPLGEDYQAALREAREKRWIDPYENVGKSSGAYSWGSYQSHPYVSMNYKPNLDSLLTIAHEMGHAMHTYHSNAAQPYPKSDYSLFVAEVASTCNEILVLHALMKRYPAREAQAFLAYQLLDGFRTTVFRQTMFAEFERKAHEMAESGEALTCESLNAMYAALNRDYYQSVEQDELIAYEWMRIPHFYRSFYVYKYATGFSAATALAGAILREGAPAVERYKKFLSLGGSLHPIEALRVAGVDMEKPEAVESALEEFESVLARYEELTK